MATLEAIFRGCLLANRAEKFPKLVVLSDRRPGGLDELAPQPAISAMGDRSAIGSISGRVLRGDHAQKPCQLADVFNLSPISDPGHKLAGHNPADPGDAHQVLNTLGQFRIALTEAADLSGRLHRLLFRKLQTVKQLIELKAHGLRALKLSKLSFHLQRPLRCRREPEETQSLQRATAI